MCLTCVATLPGVCQASKGNELLAVGQITNIVCKNDPAMSYALYLPTAYASGKVWPIIYFFDPGGRGRRPVELYKDIAEKYGFLIVGSNNSRNFSSDQSKSVNAIWLDTHVRLALDVDRIYTSGFSGGARVAGAMALGCPPCRIAGVIALGAGYPNNKPDTEIKLLYYFAVGDQDFNWPEVVTIRREREDAGLPYRVQVYPGTHQWAPPAIFEDAVQWLTLRAMQTGDLAPDAAFIDRMLRQRHVEANEAEKKLDVIAQFQAYRSMTSDFAGLRDVAESEIKLATLKTSGAVKAALKNEREQIAEQSALEGEVSPKLHAYMNGSADDSMTLGNDIVRAMRRLDYQAEHAKNETQRLVSKRAADGLWVAVIEAGQQELESRHFEKADACFELISRVRDEPWPLLMLAETHALAGDKKRAIRDLQEAVRRGLKDAEAIESNDRLQVLKPDEEFQRLLQELERK
jgi:dienelactone hydrolase